MKFQGNSIHRSDCGTAFTYNSKEQESIIFNNDSSISKCCPSYYRTRLFGLDLLKSFEQHSLSIRDDTPNIIKNVSEA